MSNTNSALVRRGATALAQSGGTETVGNFMLKSAAGAGVIGFVAWLLPFGFLFWFLVFVAAGVAAKVAGR